MQPITEGRAHLSSTLPTLQIAWDSTSLKDLICPRKYYYSQLCGLRAKDSSHHLDFGIHFHKAGEHYAKFRALGYKHDAAVHATTWQLLIETDGWESGDSKKNRETLIRSAVWYLDEYQFANLKTVTLPNGKPATELSFRLKIPALAPTGEQYLLCGHLDEVCETEDGKWWILDKKTTSGALGNFYFDQYSPDIQMTAYSFAGQIVLEKPVEGIVVDAAQVLVGGTKFARGFVHRTKGQLEEFVSELIFWLRMAEMYAQNNHWPMQPQACGMYGGCVFRKICSKDPAVRDNFIAGYFDQKPWNPLDEREVKDV